MEKFTQVEGAAIPLLQPNVDTDVIIRIERLTSVAKDDLGKYAFEALRYDARGKPDPDSVFNQTQYKNAPILIAGPNFGCGSSREGAVWALYSLGIRCVIAESFGDIFFNNCFQNGMLPVRASPDAVYQLSVKARDGVAIHVDLAAQRVSCGAEFSFGFDVDPIKKEALYEGLDDIEQTLRRRADIHDWQSKNRAARPWVWQV